MSSCWPAGSVTGLGSLPGTDRVESTRLVFGELPELPHLPELPERGVGADLIGRTAGLLVDLPVEVVPSGWRITARPGRDVRRARDILSWDLDTLEEQALGYSGALKIQVAGPWTLAAGLEVPSGHRVVSDHGASRDLAESLAAGLRAHLEDLARRVPAATLIVQVDEPSLLAVLRGRVATPSGYGTVPARDASVIEQHLRSVLMVAPEGARVVHCCAADVPIALLRAAGADALAVDAALLESGQYDALGEAVEAGMSLWLGVLPAVDAPVSFVAARAGIRRLWSALGFAPGQLAETVVPTPSCGFAGASPPHVRRVLAVLRDVGRDLVDPLERPSADLDG